MEKSRKNDAARKRLLQQIACYDGCFKHEGVKVTGMKRLSANVQERLREETEQVSAANPVKMKLPVKVTVFGDPRTKKNSPRIVGGGERCKVCGKPRKQWILQSKQHEAYSKECKKQIRSFLDLYGKNKPEPIDSPVNCKYTFFMRTRRKVDGLNLCASIDDILVECGVLADDNSNIVISHDGTRVKYDRENPRVEILIEKTE